MYAPRWLSAVAALGLLAPAALSMSAASERWAHDLTEGIRRAEYHFVEREDGSWSAPNRAQNLRLGFSLEGLEVGARTALAGGERPGWALRLRLQAFGRDGALLPVADAFPEAEESRVVFRRGDLDEWYANRPDGLKQGFTIHRAPAGSGLPLTLEMGFGGGLMARMTDDGSAILFSAPGQGPVLRYTELYVTDAGGERVPAELVLAAGRLRIVIHDEGARYPLDVDPLVTSPSWVTDGDQAFGNLGVSVASAGDVNNDGFDDLIVGAYRYDNGQQDEGRAFVFLGGSAGPQASPQWTAESNQVSARFGWSVASAGDVNNDGFDDVIVGAPQYDGGQNDEGRVWLYLGSATGVVASAAWVTESDQVSAQFGYSVASAGDVDNDGFDDIVIGAKFYDNGESNEGAIFAYYGSTGGPSLAADWTAEGDQVGAEMGYSVSTAGDVDDDGFDDVIVGLRAFDNGEFNEGAAYVFTGSAAGLGATPAWTAEGDQDTADFGYSVSTAGDVNGDGFDDVIVGARLYTNDQSKEGRVYVFHGSASGLGAAPAWSAESDQSNSDFGASVATLGDANNDAFSDVIVGARSFDGAETNEGAAFVYAGSATGLEAAPSWSVEGGQAGAEFGYAVAGAGDVDGDGNDDGLVGMRSYNAAAGTNAGRALVFTAFNPFFSLRFPGNGVVYFADDPPDEFRWFTGDKTQFKVQWSRSPNFGKPKKSSGKAWLQAVDLFTPDPALWVRILKLGKTTGTVYWRVRGKSGSSSLEDTEGRSLDVAPAAPPSATLPTDGQVFLSSDAAPLMTWDENHNEVYRVVFSPSPRLGKPKATSGKGYKLSGDSWQLPDDVWDKMVTRLAPKSIDGQGTLYWAVFAKDALGRTTQTPTRTIRIAGAD